MVDGACQSSEAVLGCHFGDCPDQIISHTPIGWLIADYCSKALNVNSLDMVVKNPPGTQNNLMQPLELGCAENF